MSDSNQELKKGTLKDNQRLDIYQPQVQKINSIVREYKELKEKYGIVIKKKEEFDSFINNMEHIRKETLLIMGILSILAIFFDFWVSSKTISWLPSLISSSHKANTSLTFLFSIIFSLFDGFISILSSGLLAKSKIEYHKNRKGWLSLLWILFVMKTALFILFLNTNQYNNFTQIGLGEILIVVFTFVVYLILHFGGAGLYYIIKNIIIYIDLEILNDYRSKEKQYHSEKDKLDRDIDKYGNNKQEVYSLYPVDNLN